MSGLATGGVTKPRDGGPVRSGPVAAAKQESACHDHHCSPTDLILKTGPPPEVTYWPVADASGTCHTSGMAEHAESSEKNVTDKSPRPKRGVDVDWRKAKDQVVALVAGIIRWVGLIFAVILVLHIIFTIGGANPSNGIVSWIRDWADTLSIGFKDLFEPADEKLRVLVNYGIAALFWLIVSSIVVKVIRRLFGATS